MNSSDKEKTIFRDLLIKSIDGQITPQEVEQFNALLETYPDLEDYYIKCVQLQSALRDIRIINDLNMSDPPDYKDQALWNALADAEKKAPAIEIPQESEIPIQKVQHPEMIHKISRGSLFTLFTAAAAIVLIFVFARFAPQETGLKVAVLTDCMDAQWANTDIALEKGSAIFTSRESLVLRKGFAKLVFDNQAQVTLEGPAKIQILAEDKINLQAGKLYSVVPPGAIGFMITTQDTKVIDLGTEFGVEVDSQGDTSLHVMQGKITLIAGEKSSKASMEVTAGKAKKVLCFTQVVSDIAFREDVFVRNINSNANMLWRGQKELNLADIVGGGNGLGTGKISMGIDPISGKPAGDIRERRKSSNNYHSVSSNPYIDGVFVPSGRTQQIVSSQGHLFRECPITNGFCYENIIGHNVSSLDTRVSQASDMQIHSMLMHANIGITFNLQAIQQYLPGVKIARFQSKFGIRRWATNPDTSNADFWVLVDGKLRYAKQQVKIDELHSIDIELSEQDRFLTLIETDGGDPEGRILNGVVLPPNDSDWGIFIDPILVLK